VSHTCGLCAGLALFAGPQQAQTPSGSVSEAGSFAHGLEDVAFWFISNTFALWAETHILCSLYYSPEQSHSCVIEWWFSGSRIYPAGFTVTLR
jgi:hypothetical protein